MALFLKSPPPSLAVHPGPGSLLRKGDHDIQKGKEKISTEPSANNGAKKKFCKDSRREEI